MSRVADLRPPWPFNVAGRSTWRYDSGGTILYGQGYRYGSVLPGEWRKQIDATIEYW